MCVPPRTLHTRIPSAQRVRLGVHIDTECGTVTLGLAWQRADGSQDESSGLDAEGE
jgi:hypothetical protein